jgi:hypothetical protein
MDEIVFILLFSILKIQNCVEQEVHLRRFNLRMSALELFLLDQTNSFLNFPTFKRRNKIFLKIFSLRPPNLVFQGTRSPKEWRLFQSVSCFTLEL